MKSLYEWKAEVLESTNPARLAYTGAITKALMTADDGQIQQIMVILRIPPGVQQGQMPQPVQPVQNTGVH